MVKNIIKIREYKEIKNSTVIAIIILILFFNISDLGMTQDAQSYYQMGYQYFSQGDYQKAEENYQRAIDLDPNFENAHYWLGKVYRQTGQYDKAVSKWIDVLKINPRNPYAFRYLNESFRDTSRVTSGTADDYLLEGLKILGTNNEAFLNENNLNNYVLLSAIPYFKKAITLQSDLIKAHYWLGEVYQALSKKISWQYTSLAISSFEKVITSEEENNPSSFQRPSEYWYAYQELMQIFQSLGLKERRENLISQLRKVKAIPYEQALAKAGYNNFAYPDTIEIIKENGKETIELWKYQEEGKTFRVVNKEVIGEEFSEIN